MSTEVNAAAKVAAAGRAVIVVDTYQAADGVKLPVHRDLSNAVALSTASVSTTKLSISSVVLMISAS